MGRATSCETSLCLFLCESISRRSAYILTDLHVSSPNLDHEARWSVLKLADVLVKPTEEAPPSVRIHIPVHEPVAPKVVLPKAAVRIKPSLPPVKIPPAVTNTGPPKLKIAPLGSRVQRPTPTPTPAPAPAPTPRIPASATTPRIPASARPTPSPLPSPPATKVKHPIVTTTIVTTRAPKGRPPKAGPASTSRAATGKMSTPDQTLCKNLVTKLQNQKHSKWFRNPVDPVRDQAPKSVYTLGVFSSLTKMCSAVILISSRGLWILAP